VVLILLVVMPHTPPQKLLPLADAPRGEGEVEEPVDDTTTVVSQRSATSLAKGPLGALKLRENLRGEGGTIELKNREANTMLVLSLHALMQIEIPIHPVGSDTTFRSMGSRPIPELNRIRAGLMGTLLAGSPRISRIASAKVEARDPAPSS
jgi:hypothetical protein